MNYSSASVLMMMIGMKLKEPTINKAYFFLFYLFIYFLSLSLIHDPKKPRFLRRTCNEVAMKTSRQSDTSQSWQMSSSSLYQFLVSRVTRSSEVCFESVLLFWFSILGKWMKTVRWGTRTGMTTKQKSKVVRLLTFVLAARLSVVL